MTTSTGESRPDVTGGPGIIPDDTFATRLDRIRKHFGLTIEQAAERTGLNYGSWSNWERGMRPRREIEVAEQIADRLGVDLEWLLFGDQKRLRLARRRRDEPTVTQPEQGIHAPQRGTGPPGHPTGSTRPTGARRPQRRTLQTSPVYGLAV